MESTLNRLIREWSEHHTNLIAAKEAYRLAWAKAYVASQAKTADARKAEADIATSEQRLARDHAETHAAVAWQLMLVERGRMESSRIPGQHFGSEE